MTRIDPNQLLRTMKVLLAPDGGIKSIDEVPRIVQLMQKFSKKLVSKCIYIHILRSSSRDLLEQFLAVEGWDLLNSWFLDAYRNGNLYLCGDLVRLFALCPMTGQRLKADPEKNAAPKILRMLSNDTKIEAEIRNLATQVVSQWIRIARKKELESDYAEIDDIVDDAIDGGSDGAGHSRHLEDVVQDYDADQSEDYVPPTSGSKTKKASPEKKRFVLKSTKIAATKNGPTPSKVAKKAAEGGGVAAKKKTAKNAAISKVKDIEQKSHDSVDDLLDGSSSEDTDSDDSDEELVQRQRKLAAARTATSSGAAAASGAKKIMDLTSVNVSPSSTKAKQKFEEREREIRRKRELAAARERREERAKPYSRTELRRELESGEKDRIKQIAAQLKEQNKNKSMTAGLGRIPKLPKKETPKPEESGFGAMMGSMDTKPKPKPTLGKNKNKDLLETLAGSGKDKPKSKATIEKEQKLKEKQIQERIKEDAKIEEKIIKEELELKKEQEEKVKVEDIKKEDDVNKENDSINATVKVEDADKDAEKSAKIEPEKSVKTEKGAKIEDTEKSAKRRRVRLMSDSSTSSNSSGSGAEEEGGAAREKEDEKERRRRKEKEEERRRRKHKEEKRRKEKEQERRSSSDKERRDSKDEKDKKDKKEKVKDEKDLAKDKSKSSSERKGEKRSSTEEKKDVKKAKVIKESNMFGDLLSSIMKDDKPKVKKRRPSDRDSKEKEMEKTKEVKKESEKEEKSPTEERLNPLSSIDEKQESEEEKKVEKPETSGPTLKKGILVYARGFKSKRPIRWAPDVSLVQVEYFELDETERTNVAKKSFEERRRQEFFMEKNKRGWSSADLGGQNENEEKVWRLKTLDIEHPVEYGSSSQEREVQKEREMRVLRQIFFDTTVPADPTEPDNQPSPANSVNMPPPKAIPQIDLASGSADTNDTVTDFTANGWSSTPPPLAMPAHNQQQQQNSPSQSSPSISSPSPADNLGSLLTSIQAGLLKSMLKKANQQQANNQQQHNQQQPTQQQPEYKNHSTAENTTVVPTNFNSSPPQSEVAQKPRPKFNLPPPVSSTKPQSSSTTVEQSSNRNSHHSNNHHYHNNGHRNNGQYQSNHRDRQHHSNRYNHRDSYNRDNGGGGDHRRNNRGGGVYDKVCKYYAQNGFCRKGDNCDHQHIQKPNNNYHNGY